VDLRKPPVLPKGKAKLPTLRQSISVPPHVLERRWHGSWIFGLVVDAALGALPPHRPSASLRCTGVAKRQSQTTDPSPEHLGSSGVAKRQRHGRLGLRNVGWPNSVVEKLRGQTAVPCQLARPRKGGPVEHRVLHERRQDGNWFCGISRACRSDPLPPRRLPLHCGESKNPPLVRAGISVGREGFEPSKLSQKIYSLSPLAAWVPTRDVASETLA
jgi:hypothetical protein